MSEGPVEGQGVSQPSFSVELAEGLRLDVKKHLIDRGLCVLGMRGSGKSYTCGVLAEELAKLGQPFVIIDLMGEYYTLREKFPVIIVCMGQQDYADISGLKPEHAEKLAKAIVRLGLSVVVDLAKATMAERLAFLAKFLEAFYRAEEELKKPYILIMDEAHRIAPEKGLPKLDIIAEHQKEAFYWFYEVAATGRHHGIGFVVAVRRPAEISKAILTQADVKIVHKLVDPTDLKRLFEEGLPRELADDVRALKPGEAVVLGLGEPKFVKIKQRLCSHGGGTPLLRPAETPDLVEAVRLLAEALGLRAKKVEGQPKETLRELLGLEKPEVPKTSEEREERPEPAPAVPEATSIEMDVPSFDYPADIIADYQRRLLLYRAMETLMPTSGHKHRAFSLLVPDAREAISKLVSELASRGWVPKPVRLPGRRILVASHESLGVRLGLAASEVKGRGVLTIVLSATDLGLLERLALEMKNMATSACPGAVEIPS